MNTSFVPDLVSSDLWISAEPPPEQQVPPTSYMTGACSQQPDNQVGQAIMPAAGFQPAGPAGKRVRSQDWL
ncbi:MAG TPA: hypothetical protein VG345_02805, partial [Bryobacteraceae bacterium]|nr:hypothetical protein [Bryobacteraceae bacterium]